MDPTTEETHSNSHSLFLKDAGQEADPPRRRPQPRDMPSGAGGRCQGAPSFLRRNTFVMLTVLSVALGKQCVLVGLVLRPHNLSPREISHLTFPGELLMRVLQMLVLPLIVSSLVTGMSSLDSKVSGRMGMRTVVYYMLTTIIAVFTGIAVVMLLKPGEGGRESLAASSGNIESVQAVDAFLDLIRNMFPPNLVEACFKQYKTLYSVTQRNATLRGNASDALPDAGNASGTLSNTGLQTVVETVPTPGSSSGVNALGLVVFSMCFGLVVGKMKDKGRVLRDLFDCLNEAILRLVAVVIWYTPVGILFLVAGKMVEMRNVSRMGGQLAMYSLSVVLGLLLHALLVLPLLFFAVTRKNPFPFMGGLLQALMTALGTSSSSATLPITFRCLEENNGLDKRVTRFVLPVGATVNMDGTALYEAVAAIFIAQVNQVDLNFGQILTISITATAASIGAAGIPQAGLVTMVIVLTSVGLPTEDISLIVAVDWFLDRLRTATNVLGDSLGAGIVDHLSRRELLARDPEECHSVAVESEEAVQSVCLGSDVHERRDSKTPT